jgi:hypothetical protein
MRGILQKCRISGFPQEYTETLMCSLFGQGNAEPNWITPQDCAWLPPHTPSATPSFTSPTTPATPATPNFTAPVGSCSVCPMDFSLKLNRSRSFRQDVEEQMLKSKFYTNYMGGSPKDDDSNIPSDEGEREVDEDDVWNYEPISPLTRFPQDFYDRAALKGGSIIEATPRSSYLHPGEYVQLSTIATTPDRLTPIFQTRCPTPSSPNTMNQRNEQDPAFLRTLNAIRQLDDAPKPRPETRPLSVQFASKSVLIQDNEAERCTTSLTNRPIGAKKRYMAFVNKLRGLTD